VLTCGPGGLCLELARQGHRVVGVDISDKTIKIAREFAADNLVEESFGSLEYRIADLNTVDLDPAAYDVVIAWDGLHHILRIDRLMRQVSGSLKSDGLFIYSDNIGMNRLSRLFGGILYLLLPTHVSVIVWSKAENRPGRREKDQGGHEGEIAFRRDKHGQYSRFVEKILRYQRFRRTHRHRLQSGYRRRSEMFSTF